MTILKHQRNNSTTILREKENNENKTLSLNKYNRDKNNDKFWQKSGNKNLYNTNSKPNIYSNYLYHIYKNLIILNCQIEDFSLTFILFF